MAKSPKEMADDILSSVGKKDAPEKILVEAYLEAMIKQHRAEAVKEHIDNENWEQMGK